MKDYQRTNTLIGWVVFVISSIVYLSTIEPTSSFWDCGEFIATAYKLEVGHPPGAPFFMILGRLFSAFVDPSNAAMSINVLSALSSSFTILFLFWTITAFAKKLASVDGEELSEGSTWAILGSGLVGALAYTFTDSFWFSAVEGEVYAISSLFTAVVFWAIMKWDAESDGPRHDRWIILIAYLMGLSIGVHLLNLLCIPAIALVVYLKRNEYSHKGLIITGVISLMILGFIQSGIIPGVVKLAGGYELFFTNTLGTGFNIGVTVFALLLIAMIVLLIRYAHQPSPAIRIAVVVTLVLMFIPLAGSAFLSTGAKVSVALMAAGLLYIIFKTSSPSKLLQLGMVSFAVILIGYSTFAMIVIRSSANPPMDENKPEHVFTLLSYLNREQYGDRPLLSGHYWMAPTTGTEDGDPVYMQAHVVKQGERTLKDFNNAYDANQYAESQGGDVQIVEEYIISDERKNSVYIYDDEFKAVLPRMYSAQPNHIEAYKFWSDFKGKPTRARDGQGNKLYKPTPGENFRFFMRYQVGWMYWRYFMWNFSGRQNDRQGHGSILDGNYLTGLDFIDEERLGSQQNLPENQRENKGRNNFYLIPFLLGLIGLVYQLFKDTKNWLVVMLLFLLTGLAIVVYLNQYPYQPRERDYAYVGSFYAFAIWIGLGVYALFDAVRSMDKQAFSRLAAGTAITGALIYLMEDEHSFSYSIFYVGGLALGLMALMSVIGTKAGGKTTAMIATLIGLTAPYLLMADGWDDHNRGKRETALDFARNYLNSCTENSIIFTNGDNDTFPLWYVQEVEGIRTDVRVVNLSLLNTDWYTDQMKRKAYESEPVRFSLTEDKYRQGTRDVVLLNPKNSDKRVDLNQAIDFVADDKNRLQIRGAGTLPYFPSNKFSIPLDVDELLAKGAIDIEDTARVEDRMTWTVPGNYITKNNLMVLDLLAHNDWDRDVYFAVTTGQDAYLNLQPYFKLTGMAYRLTPIRHEKDANPNKIGGVDTEAMYDNVMNRFEWGNMDSDDLYLDENNLRLITNIRLQMANLVDELIKEGENEMAHEILDLTFTVMPERNVPMTRVVLPLIEGYARVGDDEKAISYAKRLFDLNEEELLYYANMDPRFLNELDEEMRINLYVGQRLQYVAQQYELDELKEAIDARYKNMQTTYQAAQQAMQTRRGGRSVDF
jgi:hypothetical protein